MCASVVDINSDASSPVFSFCNLSTHGFTASCKRLVSGLWARRTGYDSDAHSGALEAFLPNNRRLTYGIQALETTSQKALKERDSGSSSSSSSSMRITEDDDHATLLGTTLSSPIIKRRLGGRGGSSSNIAFCEEGGSSSSSSAANEIVANDHNNSTNAPNTVCGAQWLLLWTTAAYSPETPTEEESKALRTFYNEFQDQCGDRSYAKTLQTFGAPDCTSRRQLMMWLCIGQNKFRNFTVPCRYQSLLERWRHQDGYL
ncbi:unnamed protein product [Amoebophrya sp. A25]|nr:unnamed protein product [Amoebophrya sp. A25]|eukprot:GSA25T00011760001.1